MHKQKNYLERKNGKLNLYMYFHVLQLNPK